MQADGWWQIQARVGHLRISNDILPNQDNMYAPARYLCCVGISSEEKSTWLLLSHVAKLFVDVEEVRPKAAMGGCPGHGLSNTVNK